MMDHMKMTERVQGGLYENESYGGLYENDNNRLLWNI